MIDRPADAASVALIRNGEVLLIARAFAPYKGLWTLPGGRCEPGEDAETCARREIAEETGLAVSDLQAVVVQDLQSASGNWRLAVFASTRFTGTFAPSPEIADWRWVKPDALSTLRTTARLDTVLTQAFAAVGLG